MKPPGPIYESPHRLCAACHSHLTRKLGTLRTLLVEAGSPVGVYDCCRCKLPIVPFAYYDVEDEDLA